MAQWYPTLKLIHVSSVALSFSLFTLRGLWMLAGSRMLETRVIKILPHIVDTALLTSAILLAIIIQQYPFVNSWLTVKVLALVAYIVVGTIALKRGKTKPIRLIAWLGAMLIFGFIVSVAVNHNPWGIFWRFF